MPTQRSIPAPTPILQPLDTTPGRTRKWGSQLGQYLLIGVLATASYFLIAHFFLQSVKVTGLSMLPTLHNSDRYLLNRWIYYLKAPQRADIIVLRDPVDHGFSVKRVIAVAGESICLRNGHVYVNGQQLEEPYLSPGTATLTPSPLNEQSFTCGKDQYFVLGDNRNSSIDSRAYGPVSRRSILGMIIR